MKWGGIGGRWSRWRRSRRRSSRGGRGCGGSGCRGWRVRGEWGWEERWGGWIGQRLRGRRVGRSSYWGQAWVLEVRRARGSLGRRSAIDWHLIRSRRTSSKEQGMRMHMGVGMCMWMWVGKCKSCMIRYGPWLVNPLIALKFKPLLHSISMCSHRMRKANSSESCSPKPSRYLASCHSWVATNNWTTFKAAPIQKTQDGCCCSCISRHMVGVG